MNTSPASPSPTRTCCADDCCGGAASTSAPTTASTATAAAETVRELVREGYAKIARSGSWSASQAAPARQSGCCGVSAPRAGATPSSGGGCCGSTSFSPEDLVKAIGYSQQDLAATPEGANMGLSCGNPTAIASLKPGEVILDLGSGGGFDAFVAGPKVGADGRIIGVDMTADMVAKARRNTEPYTKHSGLDNVEFRLGEIENLPVADASIDVVISNCVLNLSPDKPRVWREIARVLKPGGRVAVSDLALLRPLPESVRADVEALVGCIAGAVLLEETRIMAAAAGLADIVLKPKPGYVDSLTDYQDPLYRRIVQSLDPGTKPGDYITSLDVTARKR